MHIERSVTSISWIPSEAVEGLTKGVFEVGFTHYDSAPPDSIGPDVVDGIERLRVADRFRFANHLAAARQRGVVPQVGGRDALEPSDVSGPLAVLSQGPVEGLRVVTDGAAELFGVEFGSGK